MVITKSLSHLVAYLRSVFADNLGQFPWRLPGMATALTPKSKLKPEPLVLLLIKLLFPIVTLVLFMAQSRRGHSPVGGQKETNGNCKVGQFPAKYVVKRNGNSVAAHSGAYLHSCVGRGGVAGDIIP